MNSKATSRADRSTGRPIAGLRVRKIVEEFVPVLRENDGLTFGQLIDEQLYEAAMTGARVQELAIMFEDEDWNDLAAQLRSMGGPA